MIYFQNFDNLFSKFEEGWIIIIMLNYELERLGITSGNREHNWT